MYLVAPDTSMPAVVNVCMCCVLSTSAVALTGDAVYSDGGSAGIDCAPGQLLPGGPRAREAAEGAHTAPAVQDPHPGCHWLAHHCL